MEIISRSKTGNTSSLLIQILVIFLGVIIGYLIYSQLLIARQPSVPATQQNTDNLTKFSNPSGFDFDFLNHASFKSLKLLGETPVQPGVTGKTDLFAPF